MHPVISECPICHDELVVTTLHCRSCDTRISGHFALSRLSQLSPEQLEFVETFIRCEGKLNRVGQEMDLSYPSIRSRLTELIESLGYEVERNSDAAISPEERREILAQIAAGTLSADEAVQLLRG